MDGGRRSGGRRAGRVVGCCFGRCKGPASETELANSPPALPSTVRDIDGEISIMTFTRERRVYLPYKEIPQTAGAGLYLGRGQDLLRTWRAGLSRHCRRCGHQYRKLFTGQRPVGASTITQQVAKILVGNEVSYTPQAARGDPGAAARKGDLTKQQILELYLNQIFLGRNAYGVEAAAQAYFGKIGEPSSIWRKWPISPSCPRRRAPTAR